MDYSKGKNDLGIVIDCADCQWSGVWKHYPPSFRVCNQIEIVRKLGGPRSCADIVRKPSGLCGVNGTKFKPRAKVS